MKYLRTDLQARILLRICQVNLQKAKLQVTIGIIAIDVVLWCNYVFARIGDARLNHIDELQLWSNKFLFLIKGANWHTQHKRKLTQLSFRDSPKAKS